MAWDHRKYWLIDLIAVVLIGLFMLALFLPAVSRSRESPRRNLCSMKLKQIGIALQNHHDVYKRFPAVSNQGNADGVASVWWPDPGSGADSGAVPSVGYTTDAGTPAATAGYSWIVKILPYMDEAPLYGSIAQASDKFKADAFTPCDVGPAGSGSHFYVETRDADGQMTRKHFAAVQLDEVSCPSYAGAATVAAWKPYSTSAAPSGDAAEADGGDDRLRSVVPADYGGAKGSDRLGSPPQLAAITNYVALSATHFTCMQYGLKPKLAATTEIPSGAEPPNGLIVPGSGVSINAVRDGTSKTLVVCETIEPAVNCWYDGTTTWTTGLDPNTIAEFPPENVGGFWTVPTGGRTALNVGPAPVTTTFYCPALVGYCSTPRVMAWGPSSNHSGGVVLHAAADASVHNITTDIDPTVYARLITIAGGEKIPAEVPGF